MSRPFKIVGITAKETNVLGRRIGDAHIPQFKISEQVIRQTFIHWQDTCGNAGIGFCAGDLDCPRLAVNRGISFRLGRRIGDSAQNLRGNVLQFLCNLNGITFGG